MSEPTTARARRRRAVEDGSESDGIDRRAPRRAATASGQPPGSRGRQQQLGREVADDIEIGRGGVGTIDRLGAGIDVFLRSAGVRQFGERVRDDFATEADFVESRDVAPGIDAQEITAEPRIARDRRARVGDRARRETAREADFIERDDLEADVGAFGVESIGVAEERRPAVADRAARGFAAEDPFAEPDDFGIDVGAEGITAAGFTDDGSRRRAGRQFEAETALSSVDPFADVAAVDDGFGLTETAQQRSVAREFEADLDVFGMGDLDPESDIRRVDDGFGLAEGPAAEVAAADIDRQFDEFSIGADDIELEETDDGGFEAVFEREVSR